MHFVEYILVVGLDKKNQNFHIPITLFLFKREEIQGLKGWDAACLTIASQEPHQYT